MAYAHALTPGSSPAGACNTRLLAHALPRPRTTAHDAAGRVLSSVPSQVVLICRRVLACKLIVIGRRIVVLAAVSRSWCLLTLHSGIVVVAIYCMHAPS
jgi:hypothetical protein